MEKVYNELDVFMVNEDTGNGITLDFCGQTHSEVIAVIGALEDLGYVVDTSSEDLTEDEDDNTIIVIDLSQEGGFERAIELLGVVFGEEECQEEEEKEKVC
jgi:hypothetical protein